MGKYIHPASAILEKGVKIDTPPSWSEAQGHLNSGKHLVAVAKRPHGTVALLIHGQNDFDHVRSVGADIYMIGDDLARQAS